MTVERLPCESCGQREATIHFTEIVGNEKRESHLCAECAARHSPAAAGHLPGAQAGVSITELLSTLLTQVQQTDVGELKNLACPTCGMSYADFQTTGRLGCPLDYEAFRRPLIEVMERIQDDVRHMGKVPPSADRALARHNELYRLRRELERAVLREDYAKAKELRDRMSQYTETHSTGSGQTQDETEPD